MYQQVLTIAVPSLFELDVLLPLLLTNLTWCSCYKFHMLSGNCSRWSTVIVVLLLSLGKSAPAPLPPQPCFAFNTIWLLPLPAGVSLNFLNASFCSSVNAAYSALRYHQSFTPIVSTPSFNFTEDALAASFSTLRSPLSNWRLARSSPTNYGFPWNMPKALDGLLYN